MAEVEIDQIHCKLMVWSVFIFDTLNKRRLAVPALVISQQSEQADYCFLCGIEAIQCSSCVVTSQTHRSRHPPTLSVIFFMFLITHKFPIPTKKSAISVYWGVFLQAYTSL